MVRPCGDVGPPGSSPPHPDRVVFFDGDCLLCQGSVRVIARFDRRGRFRFAPLGGATWEATIAGVGADAAPEGTVVLLEQGRLYERSTAVLRIAARLDWPVNLLGGLRIVPRAVRDVIYGLVARHRLRWFGRRALCAVPSSAVRERLLP